MILLCVRKNVESSSFVYVLYPLPHYIAHQPSICMCVVCICVILFITLQIYCCHCWTFVLLNPNSILNVIYFRLVTRDMDLPDDEETLTLIKSETDEPGEQLDTYIQDASEDICMPVPSFDHKYLQKNNQH